ncbi:hypothetical protein GF360_02855 [candidate division WWE3 bacterium]|nr:hypothetical protein [candidate division WWE3 bacterium]
MFGIAVLASFIIPKDSNLSKSNSSPTVEPATAEQVKQTPTNSENEEALLESEGYILDKYHYSIYKKPSDVRSVAMFEPFLPRDDTTLTLALYELVTVTYGKNTVTDLEPKLEAQNDTIFITLKAEDGKYVFMPVKEDTGEVSSIVFWLE